MRAPGHIVIVHEYGIYYREGLKGDPLIIIPDLSLKPWLANGMPYTYTITLHAQNDTS